MSTKLIYVIAAVFVSLTACGRNNAALAPTPIVAMPVVLPTELAQATAEPTPTTALTETPTVIPASPTPNPTSTPIPSPTVDPLPTPAVLLTGEDFGTDRNPLTGELVEDPSVLQRRPLAVKISNSPAGYVRPQAGVGQADLLFEHPTEGAITRFTAVFYSQMPADVGPIRSARLIDLEIPAMYDAALAYSGASIGVSRKLVSSDFASRLLRSSDRGYYRTGEDKPWEHTLHGNPERFWQTIEEKGENRPPTLTAYMAFAEQTPEDGEPASAVQIQYRDRTTANWEYDAEIGRYRRWSDGAELIDRNNGEQVTAANVVVVYALHQVDRSICEFQAGDVCQAFSVEIQIWGRGRAFIFRDGQKFNATWRRENRSDMLTFYDAEGDALPLQIGNTWFQIVPLHWDDPVTVTP